MSVHACVHVYACACMFMNVHAMHGYVHVYECVHVCTWVCVGVCA